MKYIHTYFKILATVLLSATSVVLLFLIATDEPNRNEAFTRKLRPNSLQKTFDLDLGFNSYYIVGEDDGTLYLGNTTAPLHMLKVNLKTADTTHIRIQLKELNHPYQAIKVHLSPPYFFVIDAMVPIILRGRMNDWIARTCWDGLPFYDTAMPVDSNTVVIRTYDTILKANTLGLLQKNPIPKVRIHKDMLIKQLDGVLDVDGMFMSGQGTSNFGYLYFYRNEFILIDKNFESVDRQQTLDTIAQSNLKVAKINEGRGKTLEAPPLFVNKRGTMDKEKVVVISDRLGKYENKEILDEAFIMDVYNWKRRSYDFSFYYYKSGNEKIHDFLVCDQFLYVLIGNRLSVHRFRQKQWN